MTAAGYSGGYGCHDQGKNNDTPGAWRCSQLEAKSTLRGTMVCPLHGGGYADHRRAPPPPPPQLAAVARRRCRSRNAVVSQPHEQHQATRNGPPDAYCRATEAFTNDGCYPTNERAFPLGYGWVEPGKGWTRSHRPIRCRVPHDAPKKIKKLATLGKDTSRDWFNVPSAQDTEWAISYLSREDGMQRHQKARRKAAREHAGHRGCHHAPKMVPPRGSDGSSASPRPSATCLAETQIMHHKLDSARIYNKGLRVSNSELARQVIALRRQVEAIARPMGTALPRQSACDGAMDEDGHPQDKGSVTDSSHGSVSMKRKTNTANRDEKTRVSSPSFHHKAPLQWVRGRCRREPEGAGVEEKPRSPRGERESWRAPPEAKQTQTLTRMGTEAEMRTTMMINSRNRPEANAQTQTEAACLASVGSADPSTRWKCSVNQENGHGVNNEEELPPLTSVATIQLGGGGVLEESGAVASACSSSERERRGEMDHRGRDGTEFLALAGREETAGEDFYSCEGEAESLVPEARPTSGGVAGAAETAAETAIGERTPRSFSGGSRASITQRPEVALSTAEASPTTKETTDTRRRVDAKDREREVVSSEETESHRRQGRQGRQSSRHDSDGYGVGIIIGGSVDDAGPSPARARRTSGTVEVHPPAHRGDELDGRSETWAGKKSLAVACHTPPPPPPPPPSGPRDDLASQPPVSSNEVLRASPSEQKVVEEKAKMPSQDANRKTGKAGKSRTNVQTHSNNREDDKWTDKTTGTGNATKKEVEDLEQKLRSTTRALASFKIVLILARYSPIDWHTPSTGRFAALPTGLPWMALALSRWRRPGVPELSRSLGGSRTTTSESPSTPTVGKGCSCGGSIKAPMVTATAAPALTGISLERSSGDDGTGNGLLAAKASSTGGTGQRERSEDSHRLIENGGVRPVFPPMPPIPPAPRPRTRKAGAPPSVPAAALDDLEQDKSALEGVRLSVMPSHCSTALISSTTHGPLFGLDHRSEEGERQHDGSDRRAGEAEPQHDLGITGSRPGGMLVTKPFLPPLKEEEEEGKEAEEQGEEHELQQQQQQQQQQYEQQQDPLAESKAWGDAEVGDHHDRESSCVTTILGIVSSKKTTMLHADGACSTSFVEEDTEERVARRLGCDEQQLEQEQEKREGLMVHHEGERHHDLTLSVADREKGGYARSLDPINQDTALQSRNTQLELADAEDSGGEQRHASPSPLPSPSPSSSLSSSSSSSSSSSPRATPDNGEAADRFCRRDAVPQRSQAAVGLNGMRNDEAPHSSAVADSDRDREATRREEKGSDSDASYRRDCAVLAGTAKIVFSLLALEHRGVSSRFYRWKRKPRRTIVKEDRGSIARATGENFLPVKTGG